MDTAEMLPGETFVHAVVGRNFLPGLFRKIRDRKTPPIWNIYESIRLEDLRVNSMRRHTIGTG